MCFYYCLHHVLPETERFTGGRRNCATFLFGSCMYAVAYVVLKNLQLRYGVWFDAVLTALGMILIADVSTVAYIYKQYYGRSIINELAEEREGSKWVFDETTRKYRTKTDAEILKEKLRRERELEKVKKQDQKLKEIERARIDAENVIIQKKRIHAAKVIQRWWRSVLYDPPYGRFYLKAKEHFEESVS